MFRLPTGAMVKPIFADRYVPSALAVPSELHLPATSVFTVTGVYAMTVIFLVVVAVLPLESVTVTVIATDPLEVIAEVVADAPV